MLNLIKAHTVTEAKTGKGAKADANAQAKAKALERLREFCASTQNFRVKGVTSRIVRAKESQFLDITKLTDAKAAELAGLPNWSPASVQALRAFAAELPEGAQAVVLPGRISRDVPAKHSFGGPMFDADGKPLSYQGKALVIVATSESKALAFIDAKTGATFSVEASDLMRVWP